MIHLVHNLSQWRSHIGMRGSSKPLRAKNYTIFIYGKKNDFLCKYNKCQTPLLRSGVLSTSYDFETLNENSDFATDLNQSCFLILSHHK